MPAGPIPAAAIPEKDHKNDKQKAGGTK